MIAYVIASVMAGLVSSAYALIAHGTGFWTMVGWYLVGGWTGFAVMIAIAMLMTTQLRPTPDST